MTRSLVRCAVLVILLGGLWSVILHPGQRLARFRQDAATIYTLHQLRGLFPEAQQIVLTYVEDGWVIFDVVLPQDVETRRIAQEIEWRMACGELLAEAELLAADQADANGYLNH